MEKSGIRGGNNLPALHLHANTVATCARCCEAVLPHPLVGVIFHYSSTLDYKPEFTSMVSPNMGSAEVSVLRERYGAAPHGLEGVVILAPAAKVSERSAEYPGIEVLPIAFAASELKAAHWRFLMGAVGSQSMYIRQLGQIMKSSEASSPSTAFARR